MIEVVEFLISKNDNIIKQSNDIEGLSGGDDDDGEEITNWYSTSRFKKIWKRFSSNNNS